MKLGLAILAFGASFAAATPFKVIDAVPVADDELPRFAAAPVAARHPGHTCPVIFPKPDAECAGRSSSTCWSPGSTDVDCAPEELCCFDGCSNHCVGAESNEDELPEVPEEELPPPPPTGYQVPCRTEYVTKYETVEKDVCEMVPGPEKCEIEFDNVCESKCETKFHYVTKNVTETLCKVAYVPKCRTVTKDVCRTEYKEVPSVAQVPKCYTETEEKCENVVKNVCSTVSAKKCWFVDVNINVPVQKEVCTEVDEQKCHTETQPECRDVTKTRHATRTEQKCESVQGEPICEQKCVDKTVCSLHTSTKYEKKCRPFDRVSCHDVMTEECEGSKTNSYQPYTCRDVVKKVCKTVKDQKCEMKPVTVEKQQCKVVPNCSNVCKKGEVKNVCQDVTIPYVESYVDTVCKDKQVQKCHTIKVPSCHTVTQDNWVLEKKEVCGDYPETKCEDVTEPKCVTVSVEKCDTVEEPQVEWEPYQECSTVDEEVCDGEEAKQECKPVVMQQKERVEKTECNPVCRDVPKHVCQPGPQVEKCTKMPQTMEYQVPTQVC